MKEYKVLTVKDKWFWGRFDATRLEGMLNTLAADGWLVVGAFSNSILGIGRKRDELVMILERDALTVGDEL